MTMPKPAAGIATQIANIEATYGKTMKEWGRIIAKSGLAKHTEIVAMLKSAHGLAHGAAHRVSLVTRAAQIGGSDSPIDPVADLYAGTKRGLLPIQDALMDALAKIGSFEVVPKKGYLSLIRRKQFAMIKPAAKHVDVGLVLKDVTSGGRLESAATFNRLFTHRLRVTSAKEVDAELRGWLKKAFVGAG
jgi:hypothetical protein